MKKVILGIAIIAISTATSKAQGITGNTVFSIGLEAGLPVGTSGIGDIYSFAIGGSLQVEHYVAPDFGLTLKAGYLDYLAKGGGGGNGLIPILAGFRYHFNPRVYGSAQLGISLATESGGGSAFTYAPGVGFQVSRNFDILVRYEATAKNSVTIGNIGARFAYNFE